ncbi:MAG TPA: hypothetical protein VMO47_08895 [Rhodothermales bacterium]|nr:hypothetical protein [Rhodothermales bacterium]
MDKRRVMVVTALLTIISMQGVAQNSVRWSGLFYMDYEYVLSSSDEEQEGENGFDYRRMYLTADYTLSEEFSGRARLEGAGGPETIRPFVKDLYLTWHGVLGDGHNLIFGVQPPPAFTLSEKIWGYRSLEKTIMDRQGVSSSRDMGVSAAGALAGDGELTYSLMVGNNNSIRGEDDKYKRVYGQLAFLSGNVAASVGGDYASGEDRNAVTASAFAGYALKQIRLGVEGFFQQFDYVNSNVSTDRRGLSGWIVTPVTEKVELVGRVDVVENDVGSGSVDETYLIGGVAFKPNRKVHFIPNVYVVDMTGQSDLEIAGRVTLHADF